MGDFFTQVECKALGEKRQQIVCGHIWVEINKTMKSNVKVL